MTKDPSLLDLCDRLNDVVRELSAVDYALLGRPGIEVSDRVLGGFCMIISRQIEEIEAVTDALHP